MDVPTVIIMGHGLSVEFTDETVGDASVHPVVSASSCRTAAARRRARTNGLVATKEAIPDALWQVYEAETGEEAAEENAFIESSEQSNGGH